MSDGPNIARIAALIGEPARAEILTALMSGQSLTATELAERAGVTKQTASTHLAKLREARLLAMDRQGRRSYFRLADRDVAQLLESLMGVAYRAGALTLRAGPRELALRKARVCYDHLAGELGVQTFDGLERRRHLRRAGDVLELTATGRRFFHDFGLDVDMLGQQRRPLCRSCLDWSMRRSHLAGALGAALLDRCLELRWARRSGSSRTVDFSVPGERAFRKQFEWV